MENERNRQVSQKLKTLEQSQKRPHAIIIRGAHDDGSHGLKCLMGLRPGVGRTIPMRMPWCGLFGCGDLREVVFGVALSSRTCSFGPTVPRRGW